MEWLKRCELYLKSIDDKEAALSPFLSRLPSEMWIKYENIMKKEDEMKDVSEVLRKLKKEYTSEMYSISHNSSYFPIGSDILSYGTHWRSHIHLSCGNV